jgi:orotate phosphoribosyltransferase
MGGGRVTDTEVLQIFRDTRALLDGQFVVRSGLHGGQYSPCALVLQYPRVAETTAK